MHFAFPIILATLTVSTKAQGFVHFDVDKRAPPIPDTHLGRRAGNAVNAALYQNLNNLQEYIINITIGTPGQRLGVTLDTGSSDLWVPSSSFCRRGRCDFGSFNPSGSSSYKLLDAGAFNITYALPGDSDAGDWVSDSVSVGGGTAIPNQIFGLSNRGYDVHGVLGIGYDSHETYGPNGVESYPSFMDNMLSSGVLNRKAYSLYLNSYNQTRGSLLFGGIDTTKYTGNLVALPLQPDPYEGKITEFYVTLSKVTFTDGAGANTVLTPDGYAQSVLLDSGTSYSAVTNDLLERLARGMGAGAVDSDGDLAVPCKYNSTNATISYTFGGSNGVTVTVPVSDTIGLSDGSGTSCQFGFGPTLGGVSILGDTFLRSAYVVYDIDNQVVALAQARAGQTGTSNIVTIPSGTTLPGVSSTATAKGSQLSGASATRLPSLPTASYSRSSIVAASPTFNLGEAATSGGGGGGSSAGATNAATIPRATGLPQAALLGAGLVAGALLV